MSRRKWELYDIFNMAGQYDISPYMTDIVYFIYRDVCIYVQVPGSWVTL